MVGHRCNTWWMSMICLLIKWTCTTTINRSGNLHIIPNTLKTYLNMARLTTSRQEQVLSQRHPRAEKKLTGRCLLTRPSLMVGSLQVSSALSTKKAASSISSRCWAISWIKISNISISHHHSSSPSKICTGLIPTLPQQILLISNSNSRSSCRKVYRPQGITILMAHLRNWARKTAESPHSIIIHLQSSISLKMTLYSCRLMKSPSEARARQSSWKLVKDRSLKILAMRRPVLLQATTQTIKAEVKTFKHTSILSFPIILSNSLSLLSL